MRTLQKTKEKYLVVLLVVVQQWGYKLAGFDV